MILPAPVVGALAGAAVLSLLLALWLPRWSRERAIARRLTIIGTGRQQAEDRGGRRASRSGGVRDALEARNRVARYLQRTIEEAAIDVSPNEVLGASAVLAVVVSLITLLMTGAPLAAAMVAPAASVLPLLWLRRRRATRLGRLYEQLPDTIALVASSVRAGHSLLQALEEVAREAPEPTRAAFEVTVREIALGASQEVALERLARRFPSEDLDLIVAAINVHNSIGGSLSRILDTIAATLRERVRIARDISALTAQQRFSAYVLAALPVLVTLALAFISPTWISALFEPGLLRIFTMAAAAAVVAGFLVMKRIAAIDV